MNFRKVISCVLWTWLLGGCVHASSTPPPGKLMSIDGHSVYVFDGIEKGDRDTSQYQLLTLENQLQVLIISNPDTKLAAVSLDVNIGYKDDPEEFPGSANLLMKAFFSHFFGHPDNKEYLEPILGKYGANIREEHTYFRLQINAGRLPKALHRFAQSFLSPIFTPDLMDEELKSVLLALSELQNNEADSGNSKTLNYDKVRETMMEFFKRYYSAGLMKLVIYGKDSITDLQGLVLANFVNVPNSHATRPVKAVLPSGEHYFGKLIRRRIIQKATQNIFFMQWQIPRGRQFLGYYTRLFKLEDEGSVSYYLRQLGLISKMSARYDSDSSNHTSFYLAIHLTLEGMIRMDEIIKAVFQYLQMLRRSGPQQWFHEEVKRLQEIDFRFGYGTSHESVIGLSVGMHRFEPANYLRGRAISGKYDEHYLRMLLDDMTADNLRMSLGAPVDTNLKCVTSYEWPEREEYDVEELSSETLKHCRNPELNPNFHLPPPNPWIPTAFDIKPATKSSQQPILLAHVNNFKLWHKQDDMSNVPKMSFTLYWITPKSSDSPKSALYTRVLLRMLSESLWDLTDEASKAGIEMMIEQRIPTFSIKFTGFDSVLPKFITEALTRIVEFAVEMDGFLLAKDAISREFNHFPYKRPSNLIAHFYLRIFHKYAHFWWQEEEAMSTMTIKGVHNHWKELLGHANIEMFCYGNITPKEAMELYKSIQSIFANTQPLREEFIDKVACLDPGKPLLFSPLMPIEGSDSVAWMYLQTGSLADIRTRALTLLSQDTLERMFEELIHQRGGLEYNVYMDINQYGEFVGLSLGVQGETDNPSHLEAWMESHLATAMTSLIKMSEEEFQKRRDLFLSILQKLQEHLWEGIYSDQIFNSHYDFNIAENDVRFLKSVKKSDLIEFVGQSIIGARRRKLSIHLWSEDLLAEREGVYAKAQYLYKDAIDLKNSLNVRLVKYTVPELGDLEGSV